MSFTTPGQRLAAQKEWRRRKEAAFHNTASFLQDSRIRVELESIEVALTEVIIAMEEQKETFDLELLQEIKVLPSDDCLNRDAHPVPYRLDPNKKQPGNDENSEDIVLQEISFFPFCCERFRELALLTSDDHQARDHKKGIEVVQQVQDDAMPNLGESQESVGTDSTCGSMTDTATASSAMPSKSIKLAPWIKTNFVGGAHETSIESILFTSVSPHTELEKYFLSEPFLPERSKERFRTVLDELHEKHGPPSSPIGEVIPATMVTTQTAAEATGVCFRETDTVATPHMHFLLPPKIAKLAVVFFALALLLHLFLSFSRAVNASVMSASAGAIFTPLWLLIEETTT